MVTITEISALTISSYKVDQSEQSGFHLAAGSKSRCPCDAKLLIPRAYIYDFNCHVNVFMVATPPYCAISQRRKTVRSGGFLAPDQCVGDVHNFRMPGSNQCRPHPTDASSDRARGDMYEQIYLERRYVCLDILVLADRVTSRRCRRWPCRSRRSGCRTSGTRRCRSPPPGHAGRNRGWSRLPDRAGHGTLRRR